MKPIVQSIKSQEEINRSKAHSPSNTPWKKGLPPVVSHKSMHYAVIHGCQSRVPKAFIFTLDEQLRVQYYNIKKYPF